MPQMLKKWRIVVNRISKVRQTTCNWITKLLNEATRIVNVFLISWFFYLFLNWPRKFPRNSRKIGRFFRKFVPENPAKFDFFFRDLPEALYFLKFLYWWISLQSLHLWVNVSVFSGAILGCHVFLITDGSIVQVHMLCNFH